MTRRIEKSDDEWRELLTPEQYEVTRRKGTERAFTDDKFDSGSGWPSFVRPAATGSRARASGGGSVDKPR